MECNVILLPSLFTHEMHALSFEMIKVAMEPRLHKLSVTFRPKWIAYFGARNCENSGSGQARAIRAIPRPEICTTKCIVASVLVTAIALQCI